MSFPQYGSYRDSGTDWLGEVPSHWSQKRLRFVADLNPSKREVSDYPPNFEVSFLPMEAIGDDGTVDLKNRRSLSEVQTGYTFFRDGDVALAKITPCFENGKGALLRGLEGGVGFGTTELIVARPKRNECIAEFLHWLFVSTLFRNRGEASMHGAGGQKRVPDDFVRNFETAFPPLNEQAHIVAFLDHEAGKIDALIEEQKRLIALLKEKRQAVIAHAVTKGIAFNAPLKETESGWMGEVPQHWVVLPLSRITLDKCDGPFGSGLKSEHYREDGLRVVRLQNIRETGFNDSDAAFIDTDHYWRALGGGHDVVEGDLLVAGLGDDNNSVGRACVSPKGIGLAMVKADCFRFRLNHNMAVPEFVALQLTAGACFDAGILSSGSTRSRIPLSTMATRRVALPIKDEQLEITAYLSEQVSRIFSLLQTAQTAIEILRERRSALISAAVTGKIDVRGLIPIQAEAA